MSIYRYTEFSQALLIPIYIVFILLRINLYANKGYNYTKPFFSINKVDTKNLY